MLSSNRTFQLTKEKQSMRDYVNHTISKAHKSNHLSDLKFHILAISCIQPYESVYVAELAIVEFSLWKGIQRGYHDLIAVDMSLESCKNIEIVHNVDTIFNKITTFLALEEIEEIALPLFECTDKNSFSSCVLNKICMYNIESLRTNNSNLYTTKEYSCITIIINISESAGKNYFPRYPLEELFTILEDNTSMKLYDVNFATPKSDFKALTTQCKVHLGKGSNWNLQNCCVAKLIYLVDTMCKQYHMYYYVDNVDKCFQNKWIECDIQTCEENQNSCVPNQGKENQKITNGHVRREYKSKEENNVQDNSVLNITQKQDVLKNNSSRNFDDCCKTKPHKGTQEAQVTASKVEKIDPLNFNAVGKLQELCVRNGLPLPLYEYKPYNKELSGGIFECSCILLSFVEEGKGNAKKHAKQIAAKNMIDRVMVEKLMNGIQNQEIEEKHIFEENKTSENSKMNAAVRRVKTHCPELFKTLAFELQLPKWDNVIKETHPDSLDNVIMFVRQHNFVFGHRSKEMVLPAFKKILSILKLSVKSKSTLRIEEGVYIATIRITSDPDIFEVGLGENESDAEIKTMLKIAEKLILIFKYSIQTS